MLNVNTQFRPGEQIYFQKQIKKIKNKNKNKIKKCETLFSSKIFQTLILEKKRDEKKEKKEEEPNLLLIFMSPITQIFSTFVPDREINYIIIIRSNISSNGKNQYY